MQTLSSKTPVARVAHMCHECGRIIVPGERYWSWFGVDVEPLTFKLCGQCLVLSKRANSACRNDDDEGVDIQDWLQSGDGVTVTDLRLWAWRRRQWIRKDGTLVDADAMLMDAVHESRAARRG